MAIPTDVAGLIGWWRADAITGLSDGAAVASWPDSSASGWNLAQGVAGNRPVYRTNVLNELPVVRFDGVDDFLTATITSDAQPTTWFLVFKLADSGRSVNLVHATQEILRQSSNAVRVFAGVNADSTGYTHVGAQWDYLTIVVNGASSVFRANGVTYTLSAGPGANATGTALRIGGHPSIGTRAVLGDIAEIVLYSTALSTTDRDAIETYIVQKYLTPKPHGWGVPI